MGSAVGMEEKSGGVSESDIYGFSHVIFSLHGVITQHFLCCEKTVAIVEFFLVEVKG